MEIPTLNVREQLVLKTMVEMARPLMITEIQSRTDLSYFQVRNALLRLRRFRMVNKLDERNGVADLYAVNQEYEDETLIPTLRKVELSKLIKESKDPIMLGHGGSQAPLSHWLKAYASDGQGTIKTKKSADNIPLMIATLYDVALSEQPAWAKDARLKEVKKELEQIIKTFSRLEEIVRQLNSTAWLWDGRYISKKLLEDDEVLIEDVENHIVKVRENYGAANGN